LKLRDQRRGLAGIAQSVDQRVEVLCKSIEVEIARVVVAAADVVVDRGVEGRDQRTLAIT
jgi:hypothetical protein